MGKANTMEVIRRRWIILQYARINQAGFTTRQLLNYLHEYVEIDIDKRTVERDLNSLLDETLDCHLIKTNTRPAKWSLNADAFVEDLGMEFTEAIHTVLAGDILERMLPPNLRQSGEARLKKAVEKLSSQESLKYAKWVNKIRYVPQGLSANYRTLEINDIEKGKLQSVQEALLLEKQILLNYWKHESKERKFVVNPLAIVYKGIIPYLVASNASGYTGLYRVKRIHDISILDKDVIIPEGFDIDDEIEKGLMDYGDKTEIQLEAKISETLANYLIEAPLWKDQKISLNGDTLTATALDTWELHFWIMSQGDHIEIVKPTGLRENIKNCLKSAAKQYS